MDIVIIMYYDVYYVIYQNIRISTTTQPNFMPEVSIETSQYILSRVYLVVGSIDDGN